ncbi:MAG: class I SAM-dependent methyltransferase [Betaproteobacteria bacterium]
MTDYIAAVNAQYGPTGICARIMAGLLAAGKDLDRLTRDDLASFDEFHAGGRDSTRELARLAALSPGSKVLDVGCGIGGPARTLAAEFGCRVTGIDLTEGFCHAARMLSARLDMSGQVSFQCASALALPFASAAFDVVWSQNVLMNIADKRRFLREVTRVLRPGGLFVLETIVAGTVPDIHFPVFWADSPALSFLVAEQEAKSLLSDAGLRERTWDDTTARSIALQRKRQEINVRHGPPTLGLNVIVPGDFLAKVANVLRNNVESRTRSIQAIYVA